MWYHPLTWIHLSTCFGPVCFTLKSPYIAIVKNRHLHHEVLAKLGKLPPLAPRNSVSWKRRGRGWWLDLPCLLEMGNFQVWNGYLVGGFKQFSFSSRSLGKMIQFDEHIFQRGWNQQLGKNTQPHRVSGAIFQSNIVLESHQIPLEIGNCLGPLVSIDYISEAFVVEMFGCGVLWGVNHQDIQMRTDIYNHPIFEICFWGVLP